MQEVDKVNSEILKFQSAGFVGVMLLFTINPGFSKISPSKLIDNLSHTVKSNAQLWDPARDHHSTVAIHNVDLQNPQDPAGYLVTENPANVADYAWNALQVGTVWLDTSILVYVKYYDDKLYPNVDNRLGLWGDLAPYGEVQVFQWTESSVPPDEWADLVSQQSNDTRPQRTKATGTARQTLFKRTRPSYTASVEGITSGSQTADFGGGVVGAAASGLAAGTAGYQDILMTTTFLTGDVTGLTGTAPFQANVFIDGDNYLLSISAASASTYSALLIQINNQLLGAATATYEPSSPYTTIRITSATTGLGSSVIIQDINLFGSLIDAPAIVQVAVPGASTTYTATFKLDDIDYDISILGDDAQTFDDLTSTITSQISGFGSLDIIGGDLVVSSIAVGDDSTVLITDGPVGATSALFASLTGFVSFDAPIDGTYGVVRVTGAGAPVNQFDVGEEIIFTTTGTMPALLTASITYITTTVTPSGADQLITVESTEGEPANILTAGTPFLTAVPSFDADWETIPFLTERQYGPIDYTLSMPSVFEPTLFLTTSLGWAEEDKVDVYINDALILTTVLDSSLTISLVGTGVTLTEQDIVDIVRPLRALTEEEADFDPDVADDGTMFIQWKYDYEYSVFTTYNDNVPIQTYYFWVQNSQLRDVTDNTSLSAYEVAIQLRVIPTPYFVVQHPK
ncbi:MAG: hypothetical protein E4H14_20185, partial [Candidatus Thorarchaeota archaeon]